MTAALFVLTTQDHDLKHAGLQALKDLKREFAVASVPGYADQSVDGKPKGVLFNWGVGVLMSAMNAAARHDPEWKAELARFVEATRTYWNPLGPVPGYDVLPGPKPVDRYYDDNAWMVMALVEAHDVLREPRVLGYAREALDYTLSGEDDKLGGGIYWREKEKLSKNTCSNAPTIAACLAVYEKTKQTSLLERAKSLYAWTKKNLKDPSDKLMWDSISLDGKVDQTKWSYNSGLMVRAAAELARITGDHTYKRDAEEIADAAAKKWLREGRAMDAGRFAHLLIESLAYAPNEQRTQKARTALEWLAKNGKNDRGLYGGNFFEPPKTGQSRFELIDQAAAARALLAFR
jgi:hypothetical protein